MKNTQLQLDDKIKEEVADEIAEVFFHFWQNRRSKEASAVALNLTISSGDSQSSEATTLVS